MPEGGSSARSIRRQFARLPQEGEGLPKNKDWLQLTTFSYVKNQASCGSCWAIAAATVIEAHHEINQGKHQVFSTQQIVECVENPRRCGGTGGCQGATSELAMDWVVKNGLALASEVPYKGQDGPCTASTTQKAAGGAAFGMIGWETLPQNKNAPLMRTLANDGPAVVAVAAGRTWFMYEGGIYSKCPKDAVIDHALVAVGYGEEEGTKYWLIVNSWGADWGEEGYIRLQRHDEGEYCGMNNDPQSGVACEGETDPVPVCGMCGVLFDSVVPHFKPADSIGTDGEEPPPPEYFPE
jgi:cathepsin L